VVLKNIKKLAREGRNLTQFTLMKVFGQVIFLGIPLVLAKFVSPEQFGSYSLSMMLVYLLVALLVSPFKTPFIKYANEDYKSTGKANKAFTVFFLLWGGALVLFALVFFVFRSSLQAFAGIDNQQFLLLFLALMGVSIRLFYDSLFLSLNKRLANAKFWLYMGIASLVYTIVAYLTIGLTIEAVFIMFFIIPPIVATLMFKRQDYSKLVPLELDKVYLRKTLVFGGWLVVGTGAVYFLNWGDNLVLRTTLPLDDIGVYNLAYQIFKGFLLLAAFTNGYFLPFLTRNIENREKLYQYVYRKRPTLFLSGVILVVIAALIFPFAIDAFYGTDYQLAGTVLYFLFAGLVFALYKQLYEPLFNALERYKFMQITNIILVVFNLGLDYILVIRWHSILAAAVATMMTYIIMAVTYEIYYQKYCKKLIIIKQITK